MKIQPQSEIAKQIAASILLEGVDNEKQALFTSPQSPLVIEALLMLINALLPGRVFSDIAFGGSLEEYISKHIVAAEKLLCPEVSKAFLIVDEALSASAAEKKAQEVVTLFLKKLPNIRTYIIEDIEAAFRGDPAAQTYAEVQIAYPGFLALLSHRISHELYLLGVPVIPRIISEWSHTQTGVDIHPGARIGKGLFIDHATGVVIGETAHIGNNVKIYQGVTLGAKSFALDDEGNPVKGVQRHPTVEDDVVIYANATILGGNTVIGKGTTIGGNVFLMESVAPGSFIRASKN